MATIVGGNNTGNWEAYFKYTLTASNASYKVTMNDSGIHNINSYGFAISSGIKTTSYIGSTAKSASGSFNTSGDTYRDIVGSWSKTISRTHSAQSVVLKAVTVNKSGFHNGTSTASKTISIPALPSYTVAFNANGGSGAPGSQKKWYGETLTLPGTKPTRVGYNFLGWATSSTATSAAYSAGGSYTSNAATTLYAVWELAYAAPAITSLAVERCLADGTVGGAGKHLKVTEAHTLDASLTLASVRIDHGIYGGAYASDTFTNGGSHIVGGSVEPLKAYSVRLTVTDSIGQSVSKIVNVNAAEYSGIQVPRLSAARTNAAGEYDPEGANGKITFDCSTDSMNGTNSIQSIAVGYREQGTSDYTPLEVTTADGAVTCAIAGDALDVAKNYDVRIDIADNVSNVTRYALITNAQYTLDFLRGGLGIAMGKPADLEGYLDVAYKAFFRDSLTFPNAKGIFGVGTDGVARSNFEPSNVNDNVIIGWGNWKDGVGKTEIFGKAIEANGINIGATQKQTITSYSSGWAVYSSGHTPTVRRFGNVIHLIGQMKNTNKVTLNTKEVKVMTIPSGFRPAEDVAVVCQGSGINRFVLLVFPSGEVQIGRYGATGYVECAAGTWFPFSATWIVD